MTPEQQTPASVVEAAKSIHAAALIYEDQALLEDAEIILTHVERLSAEREGLRRALEPFAKAAALFDTGDYINHDACIYRPAAGDEYSLSSRHLLAARAALTQGESNADIAQDFAAAVRAKRKPERDPKLQRHDVDAHRVLTGQSATQGESRQTGWIDHDGGPNPVPGQQVEDVVWKAEGASAGLTLDNIDWRQVTAYRVVALPAAPTPAEGGGE
jgi:hypothetical protein